MNARALAKETAVAGVEEEKSSDNVEEDDSWMDGAVLVPGVDKDEGKAKKRKGGKKK
jgi:hypothetical protein